MRKAGYFYLTEIDDRLRLMLNILVSFRYFRLSRQRVFVTPRSFRRAVDGKYVQDDAETIYNR